MKIKERMATEVLTISSKDTVEKVMKLMRDHGFRHLPVVDGGKLTGILSISDIRRAMPSQVSTLGAHEATYLFDKVKVKDALPENQKLVTISDEDYIEEAALLMRAYKIGALPVVDAKGGLAGIVTESNIFDAFVELLGVRAAGSRIEIQLEAKPGQLAGLTEIIGKQKVEITRIAMFYEAERKIYRTVVRLDTQDVEPIVEMLRLNDYKVESAKGYADITGI